MRRGSCRESGLVTKSVAIIGAGQIGFAAANACWDADIACRVLARSEPEWLNQKGSVRAFNFARHDIADIADVSADLVIDTIAFDEDDILRYDPAKVGRLVVISSASVYSDAQGRTLDEAAQNGFPEFDAPIDEDQQKVAAGPETSSTRKIRMEEKAVEMFGDRATILRPCAIYGPWSRHPREWWFVKRMLDGRSTIPLLHPRRSRFQTTNVYEIADAALACAERNLGGIYNIADEFGPDVRQVGEAIAEQLHFAPEFVALDSTEGTAGRTPWSIPRPFLVSGQKLARDTGLPPSSYNPLVFETASWLAELKPADWRAAFHQLAAYPWDLFDYAAEDAVLEGL